MSINESENENTSVTAIKIVTIIALLAYCVSGTLLTLANKLAIVAFSCANLLLVLQNGVTVVLLIIGARTFPNTFGAMPTMNKTILVTWLPLVFLFVSMLTSSLYGLLYVSVPTLIVVRNLSTLSVAVLEYIVLGRRIGYLSICTLIGMFGGAILYAKHDLFFSISGYAWLCINVIGTSVYQVYMKKIIHLPLVADIGPVGMSYYNNLLSLPPLIILAYLTGEFTQMSSEIYLKHSRNTESMVVILISCVLGFCLSVSAFKLNTLISATSMMVANNANKFVVIMLSEIIIESTLDITAYISAIFVLFFGWLYSQTTKSFSKIFLFIILIALVILCAIFLHEYSGVIKKNLMNQNQTVFADETSNDEEGYQSYLPLKVPRRPVQHITPEIIVRKTTDFQLPKICSNRNAPIWETCDPKRCAPSTESPNWEYPNITVTGEKTSDFVNRVLKIAWGANPPSVDLYLRSGCEGIMKMKYLFESVEIFWPRFLGSIIVVLDPEDEVTLKHFLPTNPVHRYVVAFEHVPCMPERILYQYSYLNVDRHSTADYVVTIGGDCIFHSPVTPDLIFRQGRVILSSSRTFQGSMWIDSVNAMLGVSMYDGHYMVTQPVTFALSTFSSFRKWFYESQGLCYEDRLSELSIKHYPTFCWMCQLGTYLERAYPIQNQCELYWYQHLDNPSLEPILRYAAHVTYETSYSQTCEQDKCYKKTANDAIKQGLCRAFGESMFIFCSNYSDLTYINKVTFTYANAEIQTANQTARLNALNKYLKRLSYATKIALNTNI
jgi:GDP-mannose transporter